MAKSVRLESNLGKFKNTYNANVGATLNQWGLVYQELATEETRSMPNFGSGGNIGAIDTGAMMGSYRHQADIKNKSVRLGNDANIAPYFIYVTMGTWKMPKRPILQNAVSGKYQQDYQNAIVQKMSKGM